MKYIVTGAVGFIGSQITRALFKKGRADVIAVDSLGADDQWMKLRDAGISDYIDKNELLQIIGNRPNYFGRKLKIMHLGACSSTTEKDVGFIMQNNFNYTKTLIEWATANGHRIVYASSAATYGDGSQGYSDKTDLYLLKPLNAYGYSKHLLDIWAQRNNYLSSVAGVKYFNVYGPGEDYKGDMSSLFFKAYHQIKATGRVRLFKSNRDGIGDGEQLRDFIYVKDAVAMSLHLLENPQLNGIYNIGTGEAKTFRSLAESAFEAMGREIDIEYIDMPEELRNKYQYFTQAEMGKMKETGYEKPASSLKEAAEDYISYLDNKYSDSES